ncbi:MAG: hypothetical protein BWY86_00128 [Candidatus Aminicenantes bacterium ADurb.Bin508]|nr:MAG: hypothetical protein BWY86_00128 [Candidatus Aminicenantes bacterium ADurb.Bin508]
MLDPIGSLEDRGEDSLPLLFPSVPEGPLPLGLSVIDLVQEEPVVQNRLVQGPCVLRHTQSREGTEPLGQIGGEGPWVGDRHRGLLRVDLKGGQVDLHVRLCPTEDPAAQPPDFQGPRGEGDPYPRGESVDPENHPFPLNLQFSPPVREKPEGEGDPHERRAVEKGMGRAFDLPLQNLPLPLQEADPVVRQKRGVGERGREEGRTPLGSPEVRRSQPGQLYPFKLLGGEGDRNPKHQGRNPLLPQERPVRTALA